MKRNALEKRVNIYTLFNINLFKLNAKTIEYIKRVLSLLNNIFFMNKIKNKYLFMFLTCLRYYPMHNIIFNINITY